MQTESQRAAGVLPAVPVPSMFSVRRSMCSVENTEILRSTRNVPGAFRLPLRHEVGERAGERWCSGLRGRSFLQKTRSMFPRSLGFSSFFIPVDTHAINEPAKGGKKGKCNRERNNFRPRRDFYSAYPSIPPRFLVPGYAETMSNADRPARNPLPLNACQTVPVGAGGVSSPSTTTYQPLRGPWTLAFGPPLPPFPRSEFSVPRSQKIPLNPTKSVLKRILFLCPCAPTLK